jgi:hypothetical protein
MNINHGLDRFKRIYATIRVVADNAHGGITGVHGSVNPSGVAEIFHAMDLFGSDFVDIGAGNGVLLACAIVAGSSKITGIELPENDANKFIFTALMSRLEQTMIPPGYSVGRIFWKSQDINEVLCSTGKLLFGNDFFDKYCWFVAGC